MSTIAIHAAIIAVAFSGVRPGLFTWWFDLLLWVETKGGEFIAKPLGMCPKCMAGQVALWWSVWTEPAAIGSHIINASAAILIASVLNKVYEWTQN